MDKAWLFISAVFFASISINTLIGQIEKDRSRTNVMGVVLGACILYALITPVFCWAYQWLWRVQ